VRIDLEEQETPGVFRDVAEGRADVGVAPYFTSQEGLQLFPYRSYDLCVAVPMDHELAGRKSIAYAETLSYDQVDPGRTSALAQLLDSAARQLPVAKHTRIRVHGFDASCRMIASGLGIGVVPAFMEHSHGRIYNLAFIPLAEEWAHPEIRIVVRDLQTLPGAARTFVEHLRRSAAAPARAGPTGSPCTSPGAERAG
jgi:DNA-binding transcriptional LysR family regulator